MPNDKRKQSMYFSAEALAEIQQEATRLDRSLSWIMQQAWKLSREHIKALPGVDAPQQQPQSNSIGT
jgi:uncharacterized small protein (TIGR04563 family)